MQIKSAITFRLEQSGLTVKDLEPVIAHAAYDRRLAHAILASRGTLAEAERREAFRSERKSLTRW